MFIFLVFLGIVTVLVLLIRERTQGIDVIDAFFGLMILFLLVLLAYKLFEVAAV